MATVPSDLTCLQVFNAITGVVQRKQFDPDLPFAIFLEEYLRVRERNPEGSHAPRQ